MCVHVCVCERVCACERVCVCVHVCVCICVCVDGYVFVCARLCVGLSVSVWGGVLQEVRNESALLRICGDQKKKKNQRYVTLEFLIIIRTYNIQIILLIV